MRHSLGLALLLGLAACLEPLEDECDPADPGSCPDGTRCEKHGTFVCVAGGGGDAGGGAGGSGGSGGTMAGGSGGGGSGGGDALVIELEELPALAGAQVEVAAVVSGGTAEAVTFAATLGGAAVDVGTPVASGSRWTVTLDLSGATRSDDQELVVTASIPGSDATDEARTRADNQPPRLTLPAIGDVVRNRPVELQVQIDDAHAGGDVVQAQLTEQGGAAGATWGAPAASTTGTADFSLDQKALPLPAFTGRFTVHVRAEDSVGNAAVETTDVSVTRLAWKVPVGGKVTTAPALLPDGRVVVVTDSTTGENVRLIDRHNGVEAGKVKVGSAIVYAPAVGTGGIYVVEGKSVHVLAFDSLADAACSIRDASIGISSNAAVATPSGETFEYAMITTYGGSVANVFNDGSGCQALESDGTKDGFNASQSVATISQGTSGTTNVVVGARDTRSAAVLKVNSAGYLSFDSPSLQPSEAAVVNHPIAISGLELFMGTESRLGAWRLQFPSFGAAPTVSKSAPGTTFTAAPAVNSAIALYPSDTGLTAFTRTGDWTKPASLSIPGGLAVTPVLGADGLVYVVSKTGTVHALAFSEATPFEDSTFDTVWSGPAGGTITSSPLLTCDGLLVFGSSDQNVYAVATDSPGLDATAPWPRYQHDNASTGNTSTPLDCE